MPQQSANRRQRALGSGVVRSYVKPRLLTHDRDQARRYEQDPLIFRQISVNELIDLHDVSARIVADAAAIRTPALILTAQNDRVVDNAATARFADRLSSPIKTVRSYAGFRHGIFHERDRLQPIGDVRRFVKACFSDRACAPLDTNPRACTLAEHDRLRDAGGWQYLPLGWALRSVGLLSEGIRLGWQTGFELQDAIVFGEQLVKSGRYHDCRTRANRRKRLAIECVARFIRHTADAQRRGEPPAGFDVLDCAIPQQRRHRAGARAQHFEHVWPGPDAMSTACTRRPSACSRRIDSGTTLDYVYQNRPGGLTALGRLIDRAYLNSVGWRGIRQRRVHLEALLPEANCCEGRSTNRARRNGVWMDVPVHA